MWGINLWQDWSPLARGSKFHTIHTPTKATSLPPLEQWKIWTSRFSLILVKVVGYSGFPYKNLKGLIGHEAGKETWSNKFVADATNKNLEHVGTLKYQSFTTHRYTPSTCQIYHKWIVHEHKCLSSFFFLSFFFELRERKRGYIKLGIRWNGLKVYLSFFFLMEFLWRIFHLLRANRLYAIFKTGLKKWLLLVGDILFVFFYPEYLALVPSATNPVQQLTFLLSISASVLGCKPIIWLLSSSPLARRSVRATICHPVSHSFSIRSPNTNICFSILTWVCYFGIDLHSLLWRLVNSNTRIVVILFLSSQWDTTWQ